MRQPARALTLFLAIAAPLLCAAIAMAQSSGITMGLVQHLYGLTNAPLISQTDITVGTSPIELVQDNSARFELVITNTGSSACTVNTAPSVTATRGILLSASGGNVVEDFRGDLLLPTYQHWAVCAASGGTLHVIELILG